MTTEEQKKSARHFSDVFYNRDKKLIINKLEEVTCGAELANTFDMIDYIRETDGLTSEQYLELNKLVYAKKNELNV